ncbi:MAG: LytTR family transcriptional regulator DNA-binding domain-containing protein [Pseudomonadota bacterium]
MRGGGRGGSVATAMPLSLTATAGPRNGAFAKRVRRFANRAHLLPGFPILPVAGAAAAVLMVVVGAFGTGLLPLATRIGFWAVLMAWNIAKWQLWFALTVRNPRDWTRAVLIGTPLLNLPLPLEITLALRLFGIMVSPRGLPHVWIDALAISAAIFAVIYLAQRRYRPPAVAAAPAIIPGGLLSKAGVACPTALHAVRAEDHYCRLYLADGRAPLVHHRFGDALAELAGFDGRQVHRGAWAASAGVVAAERDGRAWRLVLAGGARLPVSTRFVADLRAQGWLNRTISPAVT